MGSRPQPKAGVFADCCLNHAKIAFTPAFVKLITPIRDGLLDKGGSVKILVAREDTPGTYYCETRKPCCPLQTTCFLFALLIRKRLTSLTEVKEGSRCQPATPFYHFSVIFTVGISRLVVSKTNKNKLFWALRHNVWVTNNC